MKIIAGLGSIDEYISYAEAGADELFCGYVPEKWALKYKMISPLNRREVLYYNVQIGSRSELEILQKMIQKYKVPVTMTFNSLYYTPEQYPVVLEIIRECMELGFCSFIIADPALLLYISENRWEQPGTDGCTMKGCRLHISGETAEVNHKMIDEMRKFHISRVIFHRKNTLEDMQSCIAYERQKFPDIPLEYEAFALNEMCHFTGAFCNSLHCDELTHICRLPYRLGAYESGEAAVELNDGNSKKTSEDVTAGRGSRLLEELLYERGRDDRTSDTDYEVQKMEDDIIEKEEVVLDEEDRYLTGRTGCGLCALWNMQQAGITHLKLVSRGNYIDDTIRDIKQLKKALEILEQSKTEQEYKTVMRQNLFDGDCSHTCYYL